MCKRQRKEERERREEERRRKQFGPGNKLWGVERTRDESELREIAFSLVKSSGGGVPLLISNTVSVF